MAALALKFLPASREHKMAAGVNDARAPDLERWRT